MINILFDYLFSGHVVEKRSYYEYFQARALKFFTDAVLVGNYLAGITVSVKARGKLILTLTDDGRYVKSFVNSRKSINLKFIRVSNSNKISPYESIELDDKERRITEVTVA